MHWHSLWRTRRAHGIPFHIAEIIRSFFSNVACCVGDGDIPFEFKVDVRQGCFMFTVFFNLVVDWIMRRITEDIVDKVRFFRSTSFS